MSPLPEFLSTSIPESALSQGRRWFGDRSSPLTEKLLSPEYLPSSLNWREKRSMEKQVGEGNFVGAINIPRCGEMSWYDYLVSEIRKTISEGNPSEGTRLFNIDDIVKDDYPRIRRPLIKSATFVFPEGLGGTTPRTHKELQVFFPGGGELEDLAFLGILNSKPFLYFCSTLCRRVVVIKPDGSKLLLTSRGNDRQQIEARPVEDNEVNDCGQKTFFFKLRFVPLRKEK